MKHTLSQIKLVQIVNEREQGNGDELEMLLGKGDANDGDGQNNPANQMGYGDLPTKQNDPNDGEDQLQTATARICLNHLFAKGGKGGHAQADGL